MTVFRLVLVASLAIAFHSHRAQASCNTIPVAPDFAGARGSTDRPFLSPDRDQRVTLRYHADRDSTAARAMATGDVLVTIVVKPPGGTPKNFYIARDRKECRRFEKPARGFDWLQCHHRRSCVTARDVELKVDGERSQLSFRVPDTGAAGPVTIVVTRAGMPAPIELQTQSCQATLLSTKEARADDNVLVCIDKLGPPEVDPPGDPVFTELVLLPPSYDYSEVCTKHIGDPKCTGSAKDIELTVDDAGDLKMRVIWQNILKKKATPPGFDQRNLLASTAVEAVLGQNNRIYIPSPGFLQTTTELGGGFTPSPEFVPRELTDRPNEQTFAGTADQGSSILVFARRRQWQKVCVGGPNASQACETGSAITDCPSGECTESLPKPGEYFACAGGSRDRLPCTQTATCPSGTCRRVSETGNVCYATDGNPITPEKTCHQDSDCGAGAECGPGLFEFRNRATKTIGQDGIITLKRLAQKTRGVCDSGSTEGSLCDSASDCNDSMFGSAKCVTFRAAALLSNP